MFGFMFTATTLCGASPTGLPAEIVCEGQYQAKVVPMAPDERLGLVTAR